MKKYTELQEYYLGNDNYEVNHLKYAINSKYEKGWEFLGVISKIYKEDSSIELKDNYTGNYSKLIKTIGVNYYALFGRSEIAEVLYK